MTKKTAKKTAKTLDSKPGGSGPTSRGRTARSPINGAEIPLGAHPGNTGGKSGRSGRPTNEIRDMMRASLGERTHIYNEIADGKPMQRVRFRVADLARHVACANCGEHALAPDSVEKAVEEIDVEMSASTRDRLAALDQLARYGMGTLKEISTDVVRERMAQTLESIRRHTAPDQYLAIVGEIKPLWK